MIEKIRGCFYGGAYGDALGLATEFLSKEQVQKYYGNKEIFTLGDRISDEHRNTWLQTDWSDDTDAGILVCRALVDSQKKWNEVGLIFAQYLRQWYEQGFPELGDQRGAGIGNWVRWVLSETTFVKDPYSTAQEIWELGECSSAENGSLMRTAYIGCLNYPLPILCQITENICKTTHPDPRCIAACVYVVVCVSQFVQGNKNIDEVQQKAFDVAQTYVSGKYRRKFLKYMSQSDIHVLDLNKGSSRSHIKHVLRCLNYSLNALKTGQNYETIISNIIKVGGDADTNACVSGAVLGSYYGSETLKPLIQNCHHYNWLENEIQKFLTIT